MGRQLFSLNCLCNTRIYSIVLRASVITLFNIFRTLEIIGRAVFVFGKPNFLEGPQTLNKTFNVTFLVPSMWK